jgi:hypothetical protein
MAVAKSRFIAGQKVMGSDFSAHRERLERWKARQAGRAYRAPPRGNRIGIGHELAYLLLWYEELRAANQRDFGTPLPISFSEIQAYRELYELEMDAFDIETLRRLDVVWLNSQPKQSKDGK